MENIKDWCISRQLWWGHQIPVWYRKEDPQKMHVSIEEPADPENWYREPDVLDTWASSWLWPLAVHDWPEESADLDYFYPTDVLVTGPDIIFFWVARMIIAGYEFKSDLPFKDVYFTSILRDETGRKFSKSLGNSPDPFELFNEYGTDAVRFGTMLMSPQGLDVLFSSNRLEVGRNFMNKLWNASRFVLMNLKDGQSLDINFEKEKLDLPEQWILSKTQKSIQAYNRQLKRFHFNEAAKVLYDFTWNDFCDWYIEIAKIHLREKDSQKGDIVRGVIVHVLKTILALLHPYAPFITEELWSQFKAGKDLELIVSPWPDYHPELVDSKAEKTMGFLQDIIIAVRTIRGKMNVPPGKKADMVVRMHGDSKFVFEKYGDVIKSLCGIREISIGESLDKPPHSAVAVIRDMEIFLPLEGLIDVALEQERLEKREADLKIYISNIQKKLSKRDFLSRAPKKVIEGEEKKLTEMNNELKMLTINLEMLQ
jgi:valyl-tRNA synthetase